MHGYGGTLLHMLLLKNWCPVSVDEGITLLLNNMMSDMVTEESLFHIYIMLPVQNWLKIKMDKITIILWNNFAKLNIHEYAILSDFLSSGDTWAKD